MKLNTDEVAAFFLFALTNHRLIDEEKMNKLIRITLLIHVEIGEFVIFQRNRELMSWVT